jgi:hypothetical protein
VNVAGWSWLLVGLLACAVAAWSWLGRTPAARWWFGRSGYYPLVLGALPGFGLLLVVGGLYRLLSSGANVFLMPFFLAGVVVTFVGILHPRWWGPGWFRRAPSGGSRTHGA